jgi:hypothetical protein
VPAAAIGFGLSLSRGVYRHDGATTAGPRRLLVEMAGAIDHELGAGDSVRGVSSVTELRPRSPPRGQAERRRRASASAVGVAFDPRSAQADRPRRSRRVGPSGSSATERSPAAA